MDKVSIITPMYNSEKYIEKTIKAILNQTYTNFELIIINDKSSDKSLEICKKINDDRIKIIDLKENVGVCKARNIAIEKSIGRYVAFCDSDDVWHSTKLEEQIKFMKDKNAYISCTSYNRVNEIGDLIGYVDVAEKITYEDMLKNNQVGCLTLIYDTKFFKKRYFKEINKNEDYLLWLELVKEAKYIYGLNKRLADYRVLKVSRSSNKIKTVYNRWVIYRKYENISIMKSIYYIFSYIITAILKNRRR